MKKPPPQLCTSSSGGPVLQLEEVRELLGVTWPVEGACHCHRVNQPLYVVLETAEVLQEALQLGLEAMGLELPPSTVFQTMRCTRCKGVIQITIEGCHLVPSAPGRPRP